jgi:hypothetical protein
MTDDLMNDDELDRLAQELPLVKAWVAAVEKEIFNALQNGVQFKNAVLESKPGNRKWSDGVDILAELRKFSPLNVVAPRVPLSPTQAEKTLGGKIYAKLSSFVVRPATAPKVKFLNGLDTERN